MIYFPIVTSQVVYNIYVVFYVFSQLVKACVLTVRDVGSWWIAIPSAGVFMKSFIRGRKAVLTMIRKCKYKEIIREVCSGFIREVCSDFIREVCSGF